MNDNYSRRDAIKAVAVGGSVAAGAAIVGSGPAVATTTYYPPGNILNFGADPTGATDSSPAFSSAIAALWNSANGCAIYVPSGIYKITQSIEMKTKMRLYGDGFSSVIKCDFGVGTTIPNMSFASVTLSYPPMICNTSAIQWWSIEGLQFLGNNNNAYGAWFAGAYYGTIRNVVFHQLNKRPYTAYLCNLVSHSNIAFYECGDGVICGNCNSFSFDAIGFERLGGAYSFQWRSPNVGYGSLDMRNIWLENSSSVYNSTAYLGIGGKSVFGRSFYAANNSSSSTLQLLHLFDNSDSLTVDGVTMVTMTAKGSDIGQIEDIAGMYYYFGTGATGNALSGHVTLAKITNNSGQTVNQAVGMSTNGTIVIGNNPIPNTVTSLQ